MFPFDILNIATSLMSATALLLIATLLMRLSRNAYEFTQWQRRIATSTALRLNEEEKRALSFLSRLEHDSMQSAIYEDDDWQSKAQNALELAEHLAFCINHGIYDRNLAHEMVGRDLIRAFRGAKKAIFRLRELERSNDDYYELERFARHSEEVEFSIKKRRFYGKDAL